MARWLTPSLTEPREKPPASEWRFVRTISEDRALEFFDLTPQSGEVRVASVAEVNVVFDDLQTYAVRPKRKKKS
jgi:hypothetical protein